MLSTKNLIIALIVLFNSIQIIAQKKANWTEYRSNKPLKFIVLYNDSTFEYADYSSINRKTSSGAWILIKDTIILTSYDLQKLQQIKEKYETPISINFILIKKNNKLIQQEADNLTYRLVSTYDSLENAKNKLIESDKVYTHKLFVLTPEFSYQGCFTFGVNLLYGKQEANTGGVGSGFWGPRIGLETTIGEKQNLIPKIGYSIDALPFCLRINALCILQDGHQDYRIMPEIGLSLIFLDITYGYSRHVLGSRNNDLLNHRVSLTANIPKQLYKKKKKKN